MNESILGTIKAMLGLEEDYSPFDQELVVHINSALMTLVQLGVGHTMLVEGTDASWSDFLEEREDLEGAKMYVYLKTKTIFDPPASSAVLEAMKASISELEWRLNVAVDFNSSQQ